MHAVFPCPLRAAKHIVPVLIRTYTITLYLLLYVVPAVTRAEVLVPASDPNINYFGRFDASTASQVRFNWSGTIIEASFPGPSIGISLTDGQADYDVEIDGVLDTVLRTVSSVTRYTISTSLSGGSHTIRIMQRSENHWNVAVFGGFYLADGKTLLPAPAKPQRKIEFIGDSHTAGYGNESPSRTCSSQELRAYTNANTGFGGLVTKAFRGQGMLLGYSGAGMVRNYADPNPASEKPYPFFYDSTLGNVAGAWDFSRWIPDLVVICLGTNDYSTSPYPVTTVFTDAYHAFISRVLGHYPSAAVLCVATHTGPVDNYIRQIVAAETTSLGHKKVFYAEYPQTLGLTGCDWHPSVADDRLIAKALIDTIRSRLGWDTAAVAVHTQSPHHAQDRILRVTALDTGGFLFAASAAVIPGSRIFIHDLHGRMLFQGRLDQDRSFTWNAGPATSGCCIVRVQGTGPAIRVINK
ncbi:MAG: hypothetical protein JW768_10940 [Chitinispirillaceae bacterium]|nr:hypothetical protein [Chitinispirillaceae bacterium]